MTDNIEARLETINERLEALIVRTEADLESSDLKRIKDERSNTKKYRLFCTQFSELINKVQSTSTYGVSQDTKNTPSQILCDGLQECRVSIHHAAERLERHMQDILDQTMSESNASTTQEDMKYLKRTREEWETARQCRDICNKADERFKYTTGDDAMLFLLSNSQNATQGKDREFGGHVNHLGSHLSDESISKVLEKWTIQRSENKTPEAKDDARWKDNLQDGEWKFRHPQPVGSADALASYLSSPMSMERTIIVEVQKIFQGDPEFTQLYRHALRIESIGLDKLELYISRTLQDYAADLNREANGILEKLTCEVVRSAAQNLAVCIAEELRGTRTAPERLRNRGKQREAPGNTERQDEILSAILTFLVRSSAFQLFRARLFNFVRPELFRQSDIDRTGNRRPIHASSQIKDIFRAALVVIGCLESPLYPGSIRLRWKCVSG